jgi:DNA ligase (NAD+)
MLAKFEALGVTPWYAKREGALNDMRFVVTGTLDALSRDEAADRIRAQGGIFQTSVGKDTNYLVAGGKVGASKLAKAKAYGTQVLDEAAFLKLIGEK